MLERLRRVFSRPEPLTDEGQASVRNLAEAGIWILAIGLRGTPAIPRNVDDKSLELIANYRIDVSELTDDDSIFPFNFRENGKQVLPFFSSEELALAFGSELGLLDRPRVFQPCELRSAFIAAPMTSSYTLIYNPGTESTRRLSPAERLLLRSLSAAR